MTREAAKKYKKEIEWFINGGELLWYDPFTEKWEVIETPLFNEQVKYIINDKHVEARKYYALHGEVEVKCSVFEEWEITKDPSWRNTSQYRPVQQKKWYEELPEQRVLCRAWDDDKEQYDIVVIADYIEFSGFPFVSLSGKMVYRYAEPLSDEKIKKFLRGDKDDI